MDSADETTALSIW